VVQKKRHVAKALTWRIVGTLDTFILSWIMTGSIDYAAMFSGIEILTKTVLYYTHERLWYKTRFGVDK